MVPVPQLPPYRPKTPWFSGHLQTLRTKLHRPGDLTRRYENSKIVLPLEDGTGDALAGQLLFPRTDERERKATPLIVLLHGLGGTSQSTYIKRSAKYLLGQGHRTLLLNFRGAGLSAGHSERLHHPGRTEDIAALLRAMQRHDEHRLLKHGVVLVGYSLGGNVLLKFLGQLAEAEAEVGDTPIRRAVTVSAPLDLEDTAKCLRRPSRWLYEAYLLRRMRRQALHESTQLSPSERKAVRSARSVWEFDQNFTAHRCGYDSVEEYYRDNSAMRFLPKINVPTLLIFALDDPFIPPDEYRSFDWDANPCLIPQIMSSGGHVGFHGQGLPSAWHNVCIDRFASL